MTKEKRIIAIITILILTMLVLSTTVNGLAEAPIEWTDFNNAKLEIIPYANNLETAETISYKIKISNVTLDPESYYWIYLHKKEENISADGIKFKCQTAIDDGSNEATINDAYSFAKLLEKSGDLYISIVETKNGGIGKSEIVVQAKEIARPELLPKLGNRIPMYFDKISTKTYYFAPNSDSTKRTLNIKIGKVTDTQILKDIKQNKANGLQNLLAYAKKQSTYNYTGKVDYEIHKTAGITEELVSKMNLEAKSYYFAYIEVDTENGVYYPVEDIALYYSGNATGLSRYPKENFVWDIKEETPPSSDKKDDVKKEEEINAIEKDPPKQENDPTQAEKPIPQTGENILYITGIITVALVAILGHKKYKEYKDLK